jgi:hypothetical protein
MLEPRPDQQAVTPDGRLVEQAKAFKGVEGALPRERRAWPSW